MKTDRLQIRNEFIKTEDKPYRLPNNDEFNYTDDYVKWLEDKLVNNINYIPCCEQLTVKEWEIDFGGDVLAGLEITNNEPKIIGAMNGWGNGIDKEAITITQK